MIAGEIIRYDRAAAALDVALVFRALEAAVDGIVQRELRRFQHRLRTFSPDQQREIRLSLREMAYKILDPVIWSLKRAVQQGDTKKCRDLRALPCGPFAAYAGWRR